MTGACGDKLPITAIVVTLNEARRLRACLASMSFCRELIVCDLGSTDDSIAIAAEFGATVVRRPRVPIVEMLWEEISTLGQYPWILRLDPDEEFPGGLIDPVRAIVSNTNDVGCVELPRVNYFLEKPIAVGAWSGTGYVRRLYRRDRVAFTGHVHAGMSSVAGAACRTLSDYSASPIKHYWADNVPQMIEKHRRYLGKEGEARYARGQRFSGRRMIRDCLSTARNDLIHSRGIFGGWRGIFLAGFHLWYVAGCHWSLRSYQRAVAADVG